MEIKQFLDGLASAAATPGGGSACALAGSLSASLVAMVAGLSCQKGRAQDREMAETRRKALAIQERLYAAIEEDAAAFNAVLEAFRLPNREEKESLHRSKMVQKAYRNATVPPQKVSELSLQLLELSENLLRRGNQNAYSDAGVAAYLAYAAISGGLLNVRINLSSVKDKVFRREKEKLSRDLSRKRDRWMKAVQKNIEKDD